MIAILFRKIFIQKYRNQRNAPRPRAIAEKLILTTRPQAVLLVQNRFSCRFIAIYEIDLFELGRSNAVVK